MTDNAAVYRRFVDEVEVRKNLALIDELFHPDVRVASHGSLPADGNLEELRTQMAEQADGIDITVHYLHQFTDDDWVITHMTMEIIHSGPFMGYPATGRTARLQEIDCARIVDGRIVELWSVSDFAHALLELGLPVRGVE